MREPPTNICPILAIAGICSTSYGPAVCLEDRCALWGYSASECAVVGIAESLAAIAAELADLISDRQKAAETAEK